ncbi:MAG: hypothetical protein J3K34DRAFT_518543 [Monoraphidium minutum]|nr:MAG: hypothetical protein J3K34DRAFT_518543 [Monoraphidium minutum]
MLRGQLARMDRQAFSGSGAVRAPARLTHTCFASASGGFGKTSNKKKVNTSGGMAIPLPKQKKEKAAAPPPPPGAPVGAAVAAAAAQAAAARTKGSDWAVVGKVDELFSAEKPARPVILPSGVKVCVYKFGSKVFASQLESTAYQFPLFDAKVFQEGSRVIAEVPLDGTQYDLATGEVLKWCPGEGNMLRGVLGMLKSKQPSVPLKVYPTNVASDGTISVKLL